jgi:hypothetical protein
MSPRHVSVLEKLSSMSQPCGHVAWIPKQDAHFVTGGVPTATLLTGLPLPFPQASQTHSRLPHNRQSDGQPRTAFSYVYRFMACVQTCARRHQLTASCLSQEKYTRIRVPIIVLVPSTIGKYMYRDTYVAFFGHTSHGTSTKSGQNLLLRTLRPSIGGPKQLSQSVHRWVSSDSETSIRDRDWGLWEMCRTVTADCAGSQVPVENPPRFSPADMTSPHRTSSI